MSGLGFDISHGPSFALLRVDLVAGQVVTAEAGSMVARRGRVRMTVAPNAGRRAGVLAKLGALCVAFVRKLVGGETFFVSRFTANAPACVWLAPPMAGAIAHRALSGESIVLTAGAYLASAGDVNLRLRFAGWRGLLSREGLFWIEASGVGDLWFTSYGGIETIDVEGAYLVDNGHLVAYEPSLAMTMRRAGSGVVGFFASGEGLVCRFEGRGRVWVQARNVSALPGWLAPFFS